MKRIVASLGIVLAAVCFFGCFAALNWMWSNQKSVGEKTTQAFLKVDEVLVITEKSIDSVKGNLRGAQSHVLMVRVSDAGQNDQYSFFERTLARTAAKQIAPNVSEVQHSLERVTEASIVVNSILESLRDMDEWGRLDNNQVRDLQSRIDGVTRASMDLGELLDSPRGRFKGESAVERSERIAASLEIVIEMVESFQKGVASLRKKAQFYQAKSQWWIERGPVYVSIALGWVMISQLVVLAVAVRALRWPIRSASAVVP